MKYELRIIVVLPIILASLFMIPPVINPASPLYFLKSIREIFELKSADTTRIRAARRLEFATRRIREIKSLAGTNRQELIEPTLEKYVSNLQDLKGSVHPDDKEMVNTVNGSITVQMNVLQEVFKQVSDPRAKRSIRLTIFRVSEWFTASRPVACNFLAKEASSSVVTEIERYVLSERAQKCRLKLQQLI